MISQLPDRLFRRFCCREGKLKKFVCAVLTLITLFVFQNAFISRHFKISVSTSEKAGTPLILQYRETPNSEKLKQTSYVGTDGKAHFKFQAAGLDAFNLSEIKPENLNSVLVKGCEKTLFSPAKTSVFNDLGIKGYAQADVYNLIVLSALFFYAFYFLLTLKKTEKECEKTPELMNIEFLRILFTLAVLHQHIGDILGYWRVSWLSVEFFFVLSGFFIARTFKPEKTVSSFIKTKIIRFLPLIIFGSVLCSLFEEHINISNMMSEFFFLPCTGLHRNDGFNVPSWYISVLFWVSLFYFYLMKTQKEETTDLIIGVISFFSYTGLVQGDWANYLLNRWTYSGYMGMALLSGSACVGTGYFLAKTFHKRQNGRIHKKLFTAAEVIALAYSLGLMFFKGLRPENNLYAVLSFCVLIWLFAEKRGSVSSFFEKKAFADGARYSLSIFLTHFVVTHRILPVIKDEYPVFVSAHIFPVAVLTAVVAVILGIFAHHAVEIPAARWIKNI